MTVLFLVSCSNRSSVYGIYKQLEKVALLEKSFEQEQSPLVELEGKEKKIYSSILTLGTGDTEKRKDLARAAQRTLQEREQHLQKERTSLLKAKQIFHHIPTSVAKITDQKLKKRGEEVTNMMEKRYRMYEQLYSQYQEALQRDRQLYDLLKSEVVSFDEMKRSIADINQQYDKVLQYNKLFNRYTVQYNKKKRQFYKQAGLNVRIER
ncbi:YkyA family protein [Microbacteriaceae bacterium 4G12]